MGKMAAAAATGMLALAGAQARAQAIPGGTCRPVQERTGALGCWILTNQPIGRLNGPHAYWRLETFPSRTDAESHKGPRGVVIDSFGKTWLLTIEARPSSATARSSGGSPMAEIGPLPIKPGDYSVQYMEAVFNPGMTSSAHRHSGPEAWYTLKGEMCLETPSGTQIGRAGGPPVIIPEGPPMHLTAIGSEQRHAIVLILYRAGEPSTMLAHDWSPKGLCRK